MARPSWRLPMSLGIGETGGGGSALAVRDCSRRYASVRRADPPGCPPAPRHTGLATGDNKQKTHPRRRWRTWCEGWPNGPARRSPSSTTSACRDGQPARSAHIDVGACAARRVRADQHPAGNCRTKIGGTMPACCVSGDVADDVIGSRGGPGRRPGTAGDRGHRWLCRSGPRTRRRSSRRSDVHRAPASRDEVLPTGGLGPRG